MSRHRDFKPPSLQEPLPSLWLQFLSPYWACSLGTLRIKVNIYGMLQEFQVKLHTAERFCWPYLEVAGAIIIGAQGMLALLVTR